MRRHVRVGDHVQHVTHHHLGGRLDASRMVVRLQHRQSTDALLAVGQQDAHSSARGAHVLHSHQVAVVPTYVRRSRR